MVAVCQPVDLDLPRLVVLNVASLRKGNSFTEWVSTRSSNSLSNPQKNSLIGIGHIGCFREDWQTYRISRTAYLSKTVWSAYRAETPSFGLATSEPTP